MHLRQLPSGSYRVIVKVGGRQRSATRPTRPLARQAGAELLLALGAKPTADTVTVGDLLAGHLDDVKADWSPTTHADAATVLRRLPDPFLERTVAEVTPAVIGGLYRELRRAGWSAHRLRRVRMLLSGAWQRAITYEWATSNPTRDVPLPKVERPEVRPPSDVQLRAILGRLDGRVLLFVRLAATTGARRGELVALRWSDVDLDTGELVISRSLVQTPGSPPVERATKTGAKGFRVLALDLPAVAALRRHRANELALAVAAGMPAPVWIFSHDAGASPWRPDYPSREFARACKRAGVEGVRLHDVRHYVAVTMLQDGESPGDVAGQLGHASVATTLSTYWRHMPGRGREAAERRAARLAE